TAFIAGKVERPGAAWKQFKSVIGESEAARTLFANMAYDARRTALLDKAAGDAAEAFKLYSAEMKRLVMEGQKTFAPFTGMPASPDGMGRMREAFLAAIPAEDVAAVLFLGCFPVPDGSDDPAEVSWALRASFIDL